MYMASWREKIDAKIKSIYNKDANERIRIEHAYREKDRYDPEEEISKGIPGLSPRDMKKLNDIHTNLTEKYKNTEPEPENKPKPNDDKYFQNLPEIGKTLEGDQNLGNGASRKMPKRKW